MTASVLIRQAQQAGIDLCLVDGRVTIVGRSDVVAHWRDRLRQAKTEIIRALEATNDPAASTTVSEVFAETGNNPDIKGLPTTTVDGAVASTIRPPGLSPKLLAASLALDAQIQAAEGLRNSNENPDTDPDRWCYPASPAMNTREIDLFAARLARFTTKGVIQIDAEKLAAKLAIRDREDDDRRLCLECSHLGGYGRTSWRCRNWQATDIAIKARDSQLPADLVFQLQRCTGLVMTF